MIFQIWLINFKFHISLISSFTKAGDVRSIISLYRNIWRLCGNIHLLNFKFHWWPQQYFNEWPIPWVEHLKCLIVSCSIEMMFWCKYRDKSRIFTGDYIVLMWLSTIGIIWSLYQCCAAYNIHIVCEVTTET